MMELYHQKKNLFIFGNVGFSPLKPVEYATAIDSHRPPSEVTHLVTIWGIKSVSLCSCVNVHCPDCQGSFLRIAKSC